MKRITRQRLAIACICVFFLLVGADLLFVPRLSNREAWNLVVCWLGILDWVVIYLLLRSSSSAWRVMDGAVVLFVFGAIAITVGIIKFGGSDWSKHPVAANIAFFGGLVMIGAFVLWTKIVTKSRSKK